MVSRVLKYARQVHVSEHRAQLFTELAADGCFHGRAEDSRGGQGPHPDNQPTAGVPLSAAAFLAAMATVATHSAWSTLAPRKPG